MNVEKECMVCGHPETTITEKYGFLVAKNGMKIHRKQKIQHCDACECDIDITPESPKSMHIGTENIGL